MILGFLRLALLGLVVQTVIFLLLSVYINSLHREKLEKEYDAGDGSGEREDYIETGMMDFRRSLRARLVLFVYIVPQVLFVVLFWIHNFS
ncbi:hypothetical protein LAZ40_10660 [Cereibacter sphaeroides]|uniref:hypothetical protein n=1 Tax=Rhodobacterales TaxID=204455 RepID=UPI000BBEA9D0|nr:MULTISPECIES: hypothetical protein [Paracoccaceae]MCE6950452.1 hypothetical protein [Cereibacter sphaeroides]MCE6959515.1 hypothetical protein [Cereibacter sphaeroides]MCE6968212.1 hypothetical protein [Cereibacter sphaeroides]MCE6973714.1 hypothetical protein [Cereibacter sphaeroides]